MTTSTSSEARATGRRAGCITRSSDEVDNILIDEARTPLIISGPAHDDVARYSLADKIARQLKKDLHFEVKEKEHSVNLTDDGVREAEKLAGVESFYTAGNMEWPHLIDNSLKAHHLYKRDVNYVVMDGEIIIVDEFTGRLMPGRNWSDGLHQAVEAKEGVRVKEENQTLATITLQNFFKLYDKICGMTGTAMTEASEFWKIYKLDVIAVPTNKVMKRANYQDVIFRTEREKFNAIAEEIESIHKWDIVDLKDKTERLGTITAEDEQSVEIQIKDSKQRERIPRDKIKEVQKRLPSDPGRHGVDREERTAFGHARAVMRHQARSAQRQAPQAARPRSWPRPGAMSSGDHRHQPGRSRHRHRPGRQSRDDGLGTCCKTTIRHSVRRAAARNGSTWISEIEQPRANETWRAKRSQSWAACTSSVPNGTRHAASTRSCKKRCGRQGDPGSSRFYLSLEDDLMRIFAGEWVKNILTRLGMQDGEAIESRMVSRRVEGAQKKVEERNFETRKSLLEWFIEVMDEQRKRVYGYRQRILDGANCKTLVMEMIDEQVDRYIAEFLAGDYGTGTFAEWAGTQPGMGVELDAKNFRGADYTISRRSAKDEAADG